MKPLLGLTCLAIAVACSATAPEPDAREQEQFAQTEPSDPSSLVFDLPLEGKAVRLVLRSNASSLSEEYSTYVLNSDGTRSEQLRSAPECLYTAEIYDATSGDLVPDAYAAVSTCVHRARYAAPTLYGLIYAFGKSWAIEPLAADSDVSDGIDHSLIRTSDLRWGRVGAHTGAGPRKWTVSVQRSDVSIPRVAGYREGTEQETKYIELVLVNDAPRLAQFNGDSVAMMDDSVSIVAAANVILANSGLTPRVRIALLAQIAIPSDAFSFEVTSGGEADSRSLLSAFNTWTHTNAAHFDAHVLLSGTDFEDAVVGRAGVGTMCIGDQSGAVVQTYTLGASAAEVLVHELGHNLGMLHDGEQYNGEPYNECPPTGFIMAVAGSGSGDGEIPRFSTCTQQYFTDFLAQENAPTCFNDLPFAIPVDVCGDGVVSESEQCDCGASDCSGFDSCCDGSTCRLVQGAVCSDFNDACCNACQVAPEGLGCRPAIDECDTAEKCDGQRKSCPGDLFSPAGQACHSAAGIAGVCFAGACVSRAAQCEALSTPGGFQWEGPELACTDFVIDCTQVMCHEKTDDGCSFFQGPIPPEGVSCDVGKQCQNGLCVSSDEIDACPDDRSKLDPGVCGCGVADRDSDGDGAPDCNDACPTDSKKQAPGECGCSQPEKNTTGVTVCADQCPESVEKETAGACGCDVLDTDSDGDKVPDCQDACPDNPDLQALPTSGCVSQDGAGGTSAGGTSGGGPSAGGDASNGPSGGKAATDGGSAAGGGAPDDGTSGDGSGCACRWDGHRSSEPSRAIWPLALGMLVVFRRRERAIAN